MEKLILRYQAPVTIARTTLSTALLIAPVFLRLAAKLTPGAESEVNQQRGAMHEVRTEIDIEATPARVWSVLTDFPSHARWNPFVRSISGLPQVGEKLIISVQPEGEGQ